MLDLEQCHFLRNNFNIWRNILYMWTTLKYFFSCLEAEVFSIPSARSLTFKKCHKSESLQGRMWRLVLLLWLSNISRTSRTLLIEGSQSEEREDNMEADLSATLFDFTSPNMTDADIGKSASSMKSFKLQSIK
jgi:hypothetical protein